MSASVIREPELEQERSIVISRVFDAPREIVFDAWAEPKEIAHWGKLRGLTGPNHLAFTKVVRPELIAYCNSANRESGRGDEEREEVVTFENLGHGKTRLTITSVFESSEVRDRVEDGTVDCYKQTLAQLAEYLHTKELRG